jgi:hypothetical protein
VPENKGYHFLGCCKLRVFCASISSNLTPKQSNNATFCENEPKLLVDTLSVRKGGSRTASTRVSGQTERCAVQPIAGQASGGPGDPREIQFALRLTW